MGTFAAGAAEALYASGNGRQFWCLIAWDPIEKPYAYWYVD